MSNSQYDVENMELDAIRTMALSLREYLNSERLQNYGYGRKDFRRLQGQRQRCKRALRYALDTTILRNALNHHRLSFDPVRGWEYCTGQSQNEEITNLIAHLAGFKTKGWLS